jgi:6-phosphogluconolactonase
MSGAIEFLSFDDRSTACTAAAELLAARIREALDSAPRAQASLVVSGGTTPGPCFDHLSGEALDWSRVTVLPSDERWVPATDPDSNERLIRRRLLRGRAETGRVLSFFREGVDAAQAPVHIEADLQQVARPFSATLLGMGEDGHFASLFPDFAGLPEALDPGNTAACVMVRTAGSPHLRISLTLSALIHSVHTVLLIFGETKKTVFDAARAGGSAYPIEAFLRESGKPLTVIWAP